MNSASAGFFAAAAVASGWSGESAMKVAPNSVSWRVVKISDLALGVRRRLRIEREADQQAFGAADPVLLHQPDFFRPAVERLQRVEQVLAVVGDGEEPLRQLALLDRRAGAPALAVDHLLVGEHGLVDRVPVHLGGLARDQAGVEEIEEQALLLRVILDVAGGELAATSRATGPSTSAARASPRCCRRSIASDAPCSAGGVLRRHAEGVPAHRMQDVVAARALIAGEHVAHRVVPHVAHVDAPGRVGEHLQHVVFRARVVGRRLEHATLVPDGLPARLDDTRIVAFGSGGLAQNGGSGGRRPSPEYFGRVNQRSALQSSRPVPCARKKKGALLAPLH